MRHTKVCIEQNKAQVNKVLLDQKPVDAHTELDSIFKNLVNKNHQNYLSTVLNLFITCLCIAAQITTVIKNKFT